MSENDYTDCDISQTADETTELNNIIHRMISINAQIQRATTQNEVEELEKKYRGLVCRAQYLMRKITQITLK